MRFMVIVKADEQSEAGLMPTEQELLEMGRFNEQLVEAGVMLAGDGLHPSSRGVRVHYTGSGEPTVVDGPFAGPTELVAGYWIWQVRSRGEALEWLRRAPFGPGAVVELRQVFEVEDFGAAATPEVREQDERLRARTAD